MSDEDEAPLVKKARIFYGSIEEKEKERLGREGAISSAKDAIKAGIEAGHINISSGKYPTEWHGSEGEALWKQSSHFEMLISLLGLDKFPGLSTGSQVILWDYGDNP